jgi:molybdopterin/thiamine biosynthesis adenylyltransferase
MSDAERFYTERDRRTREYGVPDVFDTPVGLAVGPRAAATANGQFITLAIVNMLARLHRRLRILIPPAPLVVKSLVNADRLDDAVIRLAQAIDPFIQIEVGIPGEHSIGLGTDCPSPTPWYVGSDAAVGVVDRAPVSTGDEPFPTLGGALAGCLAAANLLRQVWGKVPRPARLSAWDGSEGERATRGPDIRGPLDVGSVLQIGAGGVGSCFAYWLREFGVRGDWRVVDGDTATLHNTNRSLGLLAADAGWGGGEVRNKAEVAATLFGGRALPVWYDELPSDGFRPDLVLPLANERSVRQQVASRGEPIILHATTSSLWEAQVHRHIPGRDDCIACRMPPPVSQVQFGCSAVRVAGSGSRSSDAALPFLSAAAGVLLLPPCSAFSMESSQKVNRTSGLCASTTCGTPGDVASTDARTAVV